MALSRPDIKKRYLARNEVRLKQERAQKYATDLDFRERIREANRRAYLKNRQNVLAKKKAIRDADPATIERREKLQASVTERKAAYAEKARARTRAWALDHPERAAYNSYCKSSLQRNKTPRSFAEWIGPHRARLAAWAKNVCAGCGDARKAGLRQDCKLCRAVIKSRRRAIEMGARGSHTVTEWKKILQRHGKKCAHCGCQGRLEKDHVIPLARGGTNFAFNLQPLCRKCNATKNARIASGAQHSLFDQVAS